ncbi:MAG: hotdog fold thioesterase [Crocinitomicaceae bacterium]|nr:hotdog fold thioesterase [Crocinitomicaceae bacterium]
MENKDILNKMMEGDELSKWLGISILDYTKGHCKIQMTVRKEMVNGFQVAHGGITYSLADSCLAFSINGHGIKSMSIETSISHIKPVHVGDVLTAQANQISLSNKIGIHSVDVTNQDGVLVAQFKGTCYRSGKEW